MLPQKPVDSLVSDAAGRSSSSFGIDAPSPEETPPSPEKKASSPEPSSLSGVIVSGNGEFHSRNKISTND